MNCAVFVNGDLKTSTKIGPQLAGQSSY